MRLFLSRRTGYTAILPGRKQFSRHTVLGHLRVTEAEVTVTIGTEIRGEISLLPVITAMTAVECSLLRGVVHMCPGTMMTGARSAMSGILDLTQEMSLLKGGSTEAEPTEMVITETIRVEAVLLFLGPSVLAEPFALQRFPPTSGWRLELASFLASQSLKLGWMITEWLYRLVEVTTT
jgi:hypothetical protein